MKSKLFSLESKTVYSHATAHHVKSISSMPPLSIPPQQNSFPTAIPPEFPFLVIWSLRILIAFILKVVKNPCNNLPIKVISFPTVTVLTPFLFFLITYILFGWC